MTILNAKKECNSDRGKKFLKKFIKSVDFIINRVTILPSLERNGSSETKKRSLKYTNLAPSKHVL